MAGRFVRASKYRHIFGKSTRKEFCYDNLRISSNAWDTNLIKVNPEYLAVNWESGGGGAFAVIPLGERGKLPDTIPMFRGHTAAVLDTDWNPFNDRVIASSAEDGKVLVWLVPDGFTLQTDGMEVCDVSPKSKLSGHTRKVGQVLFNPAADSILASASGDFTIKIWDITTGQSSLTLPHADLLQSLSWSASGDLLVTTSRDKKLRVWDVRQQRPVQEAPGHQGAKNSRAVWMGEHNRIVTTGFSRMSERQLALWEPGRTEPIGGFIFLDTTSGVCMPFWDVGSNCLYLAGKGDGNIRFYEYGNDKFESLDEYKSADPQRGIAFMPRRGVNVHENEVMRAYKTVNDSYVEPVSFTVPRRAENFQADIYPPAVGLDAAMTTTEWMSGKTAVPAKIDFESVYNGRGPVAVQSDYQSPSVVPLPPVPASSAPEPRKEAEGLATAATAVTEATAAPAARSVPMSVGDQHVSVAALAAKFKDDQDEDDDSDGTSSFEEIPVVRALASHSPSPEKGMGTSSTGYHSVRPMAASGSPIATPTLMPGPEGSGPDVADPEMADSQAAVRSGVEAAVAGTKLPPIVRWDWDAQSGRQTDDMSTVSMQASLEEVKDLLASQNRIIKAQADRIDILAGEVDMLKRKALVGSQDQTERVRQLELELETLRS